MVGIVYSVVSFDRSNTVCDRHQCFWGRSWVRNGVCGCVGLLPVVHIFSSPLHTVIVTLYKGLCRGFVAIQWWTHFIANMIRVNMY